MPNNSVIKHSTVFLTKIEIQTPKWECKLQNGLCIEDEKEEEEVEGFRGILQRGFGLSLVDKLIGFLNGLMW